jgi:hypothetical protein
LEYDKRLNKRLDKRLLRIHLGKWTARSLGSLLRAASAIGDTGERIAFISRHFLGTPYVGNTLQGIEGTNESLNEALTEVFVVELGGLDCLTFLEYVESMRLSRSFDGFIENLKTVRYTNGKVEYINRRHFFSDWTDATVEDVTAAVGSGLAEISAKALNLKEDGTYYLPGVKPVDKLITYIPGTLIDDKIISGVRTGDYLGIYSQKSGLDVSHVCIAVREGGRVYLRHASSIRNEVVDEEFFHYMEGKPGLIIYRARTVTA